MQHQNQNLLPIVKHPDKILRTPSVHVPVEDIATPALQEMIADMKAALRATPDGVGLAAPQIGSNRAVFIVSQEAQEITKAENSGWKRRREENIESLEQKPYPQKEWIYEVFVNPVVINRSRRKSDGPEGCLSVPGVFGMVARHEKITVEARDEHGRILRRGAGGFVARVIQHELDHLAGVLFIDKTDEWIDVRHDQPDKKHR